MYLNKSHYASALDSSWTRNHTQYNTITPGCVCWSFNRFSTSLLLLPLHTINILTCCCRNEKIIDSEIFFKWLVPSLSIAFSLLPKLRADTDWSKNNPVTRPDQAKHNYKLNAVVVFVVVVVDLVTCWHWHYLLTTEQWSGWGQAPAPHSTVRKVATAQSCGGHCCSRLLLSVIHLHQSRVLGISDINEDTDYTWLSTSTIQWDTWDGDQSVTLNHEY